MSQMIEAPEIVRETHWPQYEPDARSLPPFSQPRRGYARLFSGLRGLMAAFSKRRARYPLRPGCQHHQFELPIDTLARQQPYLYIKAMSN
jgi:hypothetical protein